MRVIVHNAEKIAILAEDKQKEFPGSHKRFERLPL